jgi:two-component system OmpR family sensor kinase
MSDLARERLITLRRGIERGRNLLDQLLTLAKAQVTLDQPQTLVSVQQVYRQVLEDLLPLAEAKHIDIGVEGEQDAQVWVNELDLRTLVKNLVDNAIRYTPEDGKVDLSVMVKNGYAQLRIQDSGLGIPLDEQQRVFDPFYRAKSDISASAKRSACKDNAVKGERNSCAASATKRCCASIA